MTRMQKFNNSMRGKKASVKRKMKEATDSQSHMIYKAKLEAYGEIYHLIEKHFGDL